jgi:hypothetical protein
VNDIALSRQVEAYEHALRAAVSDLPEADADEMVRDLRTHLAEVAAEQPASTLTEIVGPPDRYATELRAAAGLEALGGHEVSPAGGTGWRSWLFLGGLTIYAGGVLGVAAAAGTSGNESYLVPALAAVFVGVVAMLGGQRTVDASVTGSSRRWERWIAGAGGARPASFVRDLSAVAWALRGWGVVLVVDLYVVRAVFDSPVTDAISGLTADEGEGTATLIGGVDSLVAVAGWLAAVCLAALVSIRLGAEQWRLGKWRLLVAPVTAVLAALPAIVVVRFALVG